LGQKPPAEFYEPSGREYPERLPSQRGYPDLWEKRMVGASGQVKRKGKSLHITKALRRQEIGFKAVEERQWEVYFEDLCLGIFDESKGRIKGSPRLKSRGQETIGD
jgi:hypothetical protein